MKVYTARQIELIKQQVRADSAELLRQEAEKNPKWEIHDLLKKLADQIQKGQP
jgi:hypothetical protein